MAGDCNGGRAARLREKMSKIKDKNFFIKAIVMLGLLFLMVYANFYTINKMERYAVEAFFYQRLSAAYDVGQVSGLRQELAKILEDSKAPVQAALARGLAPKLESMPTPEPYIRSALAQKKAKLVRLKTFRQIAIVLLLLLVVLRIFLNRIPGRRRGSR